MVGETTRRFCKSKIDMDEYQLLNHSNLGSVAGGCGRKLGLLGGSSCTHIDNLHQEVIDFVLHAPRREEQDAIDDAINRSLAILPDAISGRMEAAMLKLHTKA